MREQPHHSVEPSVQKLRAADQMLTQPVRSIAPQVGVTGQNYQQWRLQSDSVSKRSQPVKELSRNVPPKPGAGESPKFSVRRDEGWEIFGLFVNAILADMAVTRVAPPSDVPAAISPKLVRALLYFAQHGGRAMTVGELAEGVGVSLGWASRVADELVSIGLLARMRNEHDRRVVQLQLTPDATVISSKLWSDREGAIMTALGEVSPEERPAIARFLRKLTAELEMHASKGTSRA